MRTEIRPFFLVLTLLIAGAGAPVQAEEVGVVYAGGTVGNGENAYAGGAVALPGARLGRGLAVRAGVTGGEYDYEANGQRIDATYLGAEIALVYQFSGDWGWANVSAGPRINDLKLKPRDPDNRLSGTTFDVAVQTDGSLGNAWRLGWFGSLGIDKRAYITQARFGPLVDGESDTRLGIEGGVQGDRTYTRKSVGAFLSRRIGGPWQGLLSGGISDQKGVGTRGYGSVGVSRVF